MIRVNLVRNRVVDPAQTNMNVGGGGGGEFAATGTDAREMIVKIAFIVLFTVVLVVYENQNLNALNDQARVLQSRVTDLEARAAEKAQEVEGIKDIAAQAQELEDKLKVLKLLSKLRLREVKTLDFMQSSIPEKVWLKGLVFDADKEQAERGHFSFKGLAVTTDDLTDFVKRLEDSAYLTEVIVIKNQEFAGPGRSGNIRDFLFTADVEVKN